MPTKNDPAQPCTKQQEDLILETAHACFKAQQKHNPDLENIISHTHAFQEKACLFKKIERKTQQSRSCWALLFSCFPSSHKKTEPSEKATLLVNK